MQKIKFSNDIWKYVWIVGIYATLLIILILTVTYKVKWETKDLKTYLYLYNCSNKLCTNTTKPPKYYSKMICENKKCPMIIEQRENLLIMNNNGKLYLYDYKLDKIISDTYNEYYFISENLIAAKNEYNEYGIIDENNNIVVAFTNNKIKEKQGKHIIQYNENNKYGIKNVDGIIEVLPEYDDIVYINDNYFAGKSNNKYQIYNYNNKKIKNTEYNYIYSYNGYSIVFYDKKVDILNSKLEEKLIIKLETLYEYLTTDEQKSLNVREEKGIVMFNIVNNENKYSVYKLDTSTGKLTQ